MSEDSKNDAIDKPDYGAFVAWTDRLCDREIVYASGPCEAARRFVAHDLELDDLVPFEKGEAVFTVLVVRADGSSAVRTVLVSVGMSDRIIRGEES